MACMSKKIKCLQIIPMIICTIIIILFAIYLSASGTLDFIFNGPKIVMEKPSPDGQYIAYVKDLPALDGPNQSLMIEQKDKTRFLRIAQLVGDVDSIEQILWAPDGSFVVYHSHLYITATRISDWQTIRIYLGRQWRRAQPKRKSTFSGAMPYCTVQEIKFPETGKFTYRLSDDDKLHTVKMDVMESN
jgi:hypothetical protein